MCAYIIISSFYRTKRRFFMKKRLTFGLVFSSLSLLFGAAAGALLHQKLNEPVKQAEAASNFRITPNTGIGHHYSWSMSSNPTDGSGTGTTGGIRVGEGSTQGTGAMSFRSGDSTTGITNPYMELYTVSPTSNFVAFYMPFYVTETMQMHTHLEKTYNFKIHLSGNNSDVIKSWELFHFGTAPVDSPSTSLVPATHWFYAGDTTTTATGRGFSQVRRASILSSNTDYNVQVTVTADNKSSGNETKYFHFGLLAYKEAGSGSMSVIIEGNYYSGGASSPIAVVNDNYYSSFSSAMDAYNSQANSIFSLYQTAQCDEDLHLRSSGGLFDLNGKTLTMNSKGIFIETNSSLDGPGTLQGSTSTLITVYGNVSLQITGNLTINHSGSTRAIWIPESFTNANIAIYSGSVVKNTATGYDARTIWLDAGTLVVQGEVLAASSTNIAISCGSNDTEKKVYFTGANARVVGNVSVYSPETAKIYASYNSVKYSNDKSVIIVLNNNYGSGKAVVYNVDDSNYSYFIAYYCHYSLTRFGSSLFSAPREYEVTFDLNNCTTDGANVGTYFDAYSCTFTPTTGYLLPNAITVTVGSTTLTSGTDYTYSRTTGALEIAAGKITNSVSIRVYAGVALTVKFLNLDGTTAKDTLYVAQGYNINPLGTPDQNVPAYRTFSGWRTTTDGSGAIYAANNQYTVNASVTFYAYYTQTDANIVEQFIGIDLHFDVDVIDVANNADTGACRGASGYYAQARTTYVGMTYAQKQLFLNTSAYAEGKARFVAWAAANGEKINPSNYDLISLNSQQLMQIVSNNSIVALVIVSMSLITVSGLAFFLIRRKKNYNK